MIAKGLVGILSVDESFVGIAALVVSALFAAAVVAQLTVRSLWMRGLYWVLNALIILTMGVGGSTAHPGTIPSSYAAAHAAGAADAAPSGTDHRPGSGGQGPARGGEGADQAEIA